MRIKQVLLNLISNSIKFTKKGHIKIKAKLINNNQIRISVEDSGIGIDKKKIKYFIFRLWKIRRL